MRAKYFAGHSLGEYSALASSGYIKFSNAIKLTSKKRTSNAKVCAKRQRWNDCNIRC